MKQNQLILLLRSQKAKLIQNKRSWKLAAQAQNSLLEKTTRFSNNQWRSRNLPQNGVQGRVQKPKNRRLRRLDLARRGLLGHRNQNLQNQNRSTSQQVINLFIINLLY